VFLEKHANPWKKQGFLTSWRFAENVSKRPETRTCGSTYYRPMIARAKHWNASYVGEILIDHRAVGEFQPKRRRARDLDGAPIPGYYPAVVSEEEWLAARAGAAQRRSKRGRTSNHVNVFAGLLKNALGGDSYHCVLRQPSKGGTKDYILMNNAAREGRGKCRSFPFATFEAAILSCLKEIDPQEILNGGSGSDESLILAGELERVESKISELEAELLNGDVAAVAKVLRQQEEIKKDLSARLDQARQKAAFPLHQSWDDAKTLIDAIHKAPDPRTYSWTGAGAGSRLLPGQGKRLGRSTALRALRPRYTSTGPVLIEPGEG
jgi:hypothetical protein